MAGNIFNRKISFSKVDDLGLGSSVEEVDGRVVNKDGSFNLVRKGEQIHVYHWLISMSWPSFFALIFIAFTLINGTFAMAYYMIGSENIAGFISKGFVLDIINLFHFSVQTMTTVGYGAMHPQGLLTGIIASAEALLGLLSFALISGLMYGRFSNPKAYIKYSKNILITPVNGKSSIQVRIANKLSQNLFDVEARMLMLHNERLEGGGVYKRYKNLNLQIDKINFLPMNWTLTHFIDENSPLFGMNQDDFEEQSVEFLVIVKAFDDSFSQMVHSRSSYLYDEIIYNKKWEKPYSLDKNGKRIFDLDKLDTFANE